MVQSLDEYFETRKCVQCEHLRTNIFINPTCDHVICEVCAPNRQLPTGKCPACGAPLSPNSLVIDRVFQKIMSTMVAEASSPTVSSSSCGKENQKRSSSLVRNDSTPSPVRNKSETPNSIRKRNAKGETTLHAYCCLGFNRRPTFKLESLKAMLRAGGNPNTRDAAGVTPMHEAVEACDLDILQALLEGGGRVNCYSENQSCNTPLHVAAERLGMVELDEDSLAWKILTTLLDAGADITAKDILRRTPISLIKNKELKSALLAYKPNTSNNRIESFAPARPITFQLLNLADSDLFELCARFSLRFNVTLQTRRNNFRDVTHIVLNSSADYREPDFQIRLAILAGLYVVKIDWLKESLESGFLLPAEDFEFAEPILVDSRLPYVTRRARINAQTLMPKLFTGGKFHILSTLEQKISSQEKDMLVKLILAGGGTVLSREPKLSSPLPDDPTLFHAPKGSMFEKCSIFILFKRIPPEIMYFTPHMKHVSVQWLYDCIDSFSIVNF